MSTDIVLNLKGVAIRMETDGPKRSVGVRQGPQGRDRRRHLGIRGDPRSSTRITSVCHPRRWGRPVHGTDGVNTGKGYVSADKNRPEDAPIGLMPIDAIYSPVKKVSYEVQPTREGQVLDYDKLTLKLETDGSITPR